MYYYFTVKQKDLSTNVAGSKKKKDESRKRLYCVKSKVVTKKKNDEKKNETLGNTGQGKVRFQNTDPQIEFSMNLRGRQQ